MMSLMHFLCNFKYPWYNHSFKSHNRADFNTNIKDKRIERDRERAAQERSVEYHNWMYKFVKGRPYLSRPSYCTAGVIGGAKLLA